MISASRTPRVGSGTGGRSPLIAILTLTAFALLTACDRAPEPPQTPGMAGTMQHPAGGAVDTAGLRALPVPAEFRRGAALFQASCASCHGEAALGTDQGPPLVHIVYEPNHHADISFVMAAERGVRAHHWRFGDMPPRPEVSREEVMEIVRYVRWLQREAGVY